MNATTTLLADVSFTKNDAGPYAGKWLVVGRRGTVRPRIGSTPPRHGKKTWDHWITERPGEHGTVLTVFVEIPWRLSREGLTDEEAGRVLDIARGHVGEFTVID